MEDNSPLPVILQAIIVRNCYRSIVWSVSALRPVFSFIFCFFAAMALPLLQIPFQYGGHLMTETLAFFYWTLIKFIWDLGFRLMYNLCVSRKGILFPLVQGHFLYSEIPAHGRQYGIITTSVSYGSDHLFTALYSKNTKIGKNNQETCWTYMTRRLVR